jgi:hypothetical protein
VWEYSVMQERRVPVRRRRKARVALHAAVC